jgi:threonine/homoserine/homoserine lactone efflux protein
MSIDTIIAFAMICFLLVISPGPNGVLFLKTVPSYGKRCGMGNLFGILSATYVHGALSFFGLSAIVLSSATLFMVIKIVGAVYLAFLGIKSLLTAIKFKKMDRIENELKQSIQPKRISAIGSICEGFLTQLLNPKVSMFYLAAFPQLIDFQNAAILDIALLVSIHSLTTFVWFVPFIFLLGKSSKMFQSNILQRFVQSFTGIVFLFFSYKILTVESKN